MLKSQLKDLAGILPVHPGIIGRDEYTNSSVLILMFEKDNELSFILQKRSANVRQGGEIGFPGGVFDPGRDRNTEDTALRETMEEMGIPRDKIHLIGQTDSLITMSGMIVDGFIAVAEIEDPQKLDINPAEVEKVLSVPVSFFEENDPEIFSVNAVVQSSVIDSSGNEKIIFPAKELDLPERYHKSWGGSLRKVYLYRYGGELIWGMTARFIFDLAGMIKELK